MCSKKGLYWRLPGRKLFLDSSIVDGPVLVRGSISKTLIIRSDVDILKMFDKAIFERDDEMGWIKGLKSNAEESSFLVKAKFGKTRTIMDDLVVIADECLENGNFRIPDPMDAYTRTRECIQNKPFYIGSEYTCTLFESR